MLCSEILLNRYWLSICRKLHVQKIAIAVQSKGAGPDLLAHALPRYRLPCASRFSKRRYRRCRSPKIVCDAPALPPLFSAYAFAEPAPILVNAPGAGPGLLAHALPRYWLPHASRFSKHGHRCCRSLEIVSDAPAPPLLFPAYVFDEPAPILVNAPQRPGLQLRKVS